MPRIVAFSRHNKTHPLKVLFASRQNETRTTHLAVVSRHLYVTRMSKFTVVSRRNFRMGSNCCVMISYVYRKCFSGEVNSLTGYFSVKELGIKKLLNTLKVI